MSISASDFERCMAAGGVAVFPADTVYGLACDPANRFAVQRLYLLKRRPLTKPSAVMFFDVGLALASLPELGAKTREGLARLLPGAVTVLLPNPQHRFPLACGDDLETLGLRVPDVPALAGVRWPVLQSSANRAGGADPRRLEEVPELLRAAADIVIDGGELPGTASTVIDLCEYEASGRWAVARQGAVGGAEVGEALGWQYHFNPATYTEMITADLPLYGLLQEELVLASGVGARRILELGTGTGETARRLLERHPDASLIGIEVAPEMVEVAGAVLPPGRVELRVARLQEPLPEGTFDLVASALCVHHLDGEEKADLFRRVRDVLAPAGRFALADVILPEDPAEASTPLTDGYDKPNSIDDQLGWLMKAGFNARLSWSRGDLAVIVAEVRE